jgi:selenocysteine lyase/cysteine desulfurase
MDIEQLRADTPGTAHRIHLNNAGAALMSGRTVRAMTGYLESEASIGGYEAEARAHDQVEATYAGMARLLGTRRDEIALFDNSTHAWAAGFYAVPFGPGDRILTGRDEYGSNVLSYLQVARRSGAELVVVPNDPSGQIDLEALADLVDERTRLIGLTYVPTFGGLVNPAAEVGRIARAAGALYLLDATQAVGQFPVDVTEIGCDLLSGTGRKFLRGPRGTGFLYVRTDALDRLEPSVVEIASATWDGKRGYSWQDGAKRFESWERSGVNVVGFGAAVEQALELGLDAIGERAVGLGARLRDQLAALPKVRTHDQGARTGAIVTASVDGVPAADVAAALAAAGVNVTLTVAEDNPLDTEERGVHPLVRLSPHYYNTEAELDRAVEVIAAL